mmetsp:Transcript_20454/g.59308  ORF Transcript_20454/g.59308 Transcript_20454/m.59308 type:complete len:285 (-) Transcript_20454:1034-1888(-)
MARRQGAPHARGRVDGERTLRSANAVGVVVLVVSAFGVAVRVEVLHPSRAGFHDGERHAAPLHGQEVLLELLVAHVAIHVVVSSQRYSRRCVDALDELLEHPLVGRDVAAVLQDQREFLLLECLGRRPVDELPRILEVRLEHLLLLVPQVSRAVRHLARNPSSVVELASVLLPLLGQTFRQLLPRHLGELGVAAFGLPRHHVHHPVRRVFVRRHSEAQLLEVALRACAGPRVERATASAQEQHVVDVREEAVARLVDDHDDGHAELRHLRQLLHEHERASRIQA